MKQNRCQGEAGCRALILGLDQRCHLGRLIFWRRFGDCRCLILTSVSYLISCTIGHALWLAKARWYWPYEVVLTNEKEREACIRLYSSLVKECEPRCKAMPIAQDLFKDDVTVDVLPYSGKEGNRDYV